MQIGLKSAGTSASLPQPKAPASGSSPDKQMFLQLLVAQVKNQNPLNPMDGTQFLGQLAQFSELEQLIGIREDLQTLGGKSTGSSSTPNSTNS